MPGFQDSASINGILKELYFGQVPADLVYEGNPAFALVDKNEDAAGKYVPVPIESAASQGGSMQFSAAQANQSAVVLNEFLVTYTQDYSLATLTNKAMLQARNDAGAFVDAVTTVVNGAYRTATISAAAMMFRNGTGSRGQISSIGSVGTGVVQLVNINDIVLFEQNMTLNATATDGGALRAGLGYITSVNRSAGQFTVSAISQQGAPGTPSGWTTSDFLVRNGDLNQAMAGFGAWMPYSLTTGLTTITSSDQYFGVNRSGDTTRMGGVIYNGQSQMIEEALNGGFILLDREGGKPDYGFVNPASYTFLSNSLGARKNFEDVKGPAGISFKSIVLNAPRGEVKIMSDRWCPGYTCMALQMNSWKFHTMGEAPGILRYKDEVEFLRTPGADAMELRVGWYGNLACRAPGWNSVIILPQ